MMDEHKRQKKLERKRKKREDKRRALSTQPPSLPHLSLEPGFDTSKMSNVLEELARPLLDELPARRQRGDVLGIFRLAMMAWNAAVTVSPREMDEKLERLTREVLHLPSEEREIVLPVLEMLVERKQQLFPHDRRLVLDVRVEEEGDQLNILVASLQPPH